MRLRTLAKTLIYDLIAIAFGVLAFLEFARSIDTNATPTPDRRRRLALFIFGFIAMALAIMALLNLMWR